MPDTNLARRSVTSVMYTGAANLARVVILFVRSVLLARMLPVATFGVYAGASAIVSLTVAFAAFGMGGAFLHRCRDTEDEEQAARQHFTLKLLMTSLWAAGMATAALFVSGQTRTALLVLIASVGAYQLTQTAELLLVRRVVHRRLALLQTVKALLTSVVAVGLAAAGADLWALLSTDIVTAVVFILGLYVVKPVWRPQCTWNTDRVRYFLRFGAQNLGAIVVQQALNRLPVLWSRWHLGAAPTGLYSRSQTFAKYPGLVVANPINQVAAGTLAELKNDRTRLSKAFFRTNALLVRCGFLLAGLLAVAAPEFISILLGEKWMPMLDAFRLMLLFALLEPLKATASNLFIAVGRPHQVAAYRLVQLIILAAAMIILGPRYGIVGIAIAVNIAVVVGTLLLLTKAQQHVDLSIIRLFAAPSLALILAIAAQWVLHDQPWATRSLWHLGAVKTLSFSFTYCTVLAITEGRQLAAMTGSLKKTVLGR